MGIGIGSGKTAACDAAAAAISSPLLETTIENAKGVVFNISGGRALSLNEVNEAAKLIYETVEADANVIFGALVDETLGDQISITVLATGFAERPLEELLATTNRRRGRALDGFSLNGNSVNGISLNGNTLKHEFNLNRLNDVKRLRNEHEPANGHNSTPAPANGQQKEPTPANGSSQPPTSNGSGELPHFLRALKKGP
jgi:hypothetical protein